MSAYDPRLTLALSPEGAALPKLADLALEGCVAAERYLAPTPLQASVEATSLRRRPDAGAEQLSQLLFGEGFDALFTDGDFVFGQARRDGYVGWAARDALSELGEAPSHWVRALRSYVFQDPSIKSPTVALLPQNALVRVEGEAEGALVRLAGHGWIAARHLAPIGFGETDPAAVALQYLGAPYLWGGRSSLGLDCSGLVQQALFACGHWVPRDSDMQAGLGLAITPDTHLSGLSRNDLVFWRGHVGMMLDAQRLIHANAFHMAVAIEPLADAVRRIEAADGGLPTAFRRLPVFQTPPQREAE
jgi:hypothetical protein